MKLLVYLNKLNLKKLSIQSKYSSSTSAYLSHKKNWLLKGFLFLQELVKSLKTFQFVANWRSSCLLGSTCLKKNK